MRISRTGNKHQGRQIRGFRESIGMKQEVLAEALNTNQQNISNYEKQETLDLDIFSKLAISMGIDPEVLKDYNASSAVFNIQEMGGNSQAIARNDQPTYNFDPIDKIIELNSKLEELYKNLLVSEKEKVELLKQCINTLTKENR